MTAENNEPMSEEENEQISQRRAKLAALREAGPAYPNDFHRDILAEAIHMQYGGEEPESLEELGVRVKIAGRMMTRRLMGSATPCPRVYTRTSRSGTSVTSSAPRA